MRTIEDVKRELKEAAIAGLVASDDGDGDKAVELAERCKELIKELVKLGETSWQKLADKGERVLAEAHAYGYGKPNA